MTIIRAFKQIFIDLFLKIKQFLPIHKSVSKTEKARKNTKTVINDTLFYQFNNLIEIDNTQNLIYNRSCLNVGCCLVVSRLII